MSSFLDCKSYDLVECFANVCSMISSMSADSNIAHALNLPLGITCTNRVFYFGMTGLFTCYGKVERLIEQTNEGNL